jgi:hypothetical protein
MRRAPLKSSAGLGIPFLFFRGKMPGARDGAPLPCKIRSVSGDSMHCALVSGGIRNIEKFKSLTAITLCHVWHCGT